MTKKSWIFFLLLLIAGVAGRICEEILQNTLSKFIQWFIIGLIIFSFLAALIKFIDFLSKTDRDRDSEA